MLGRDGLKSERDGELRKKDDRAREDKEKQTYRLDLCIRVCVCLVWRGRSSAVAWLRRHAIPDVFSKHIHGNTGE